MADFRLLTFKIIALLFGLQLAQAQVKTDSLWKVWENPQLESANRLEAIYLYAEELRKSDADSALVFAENAFELAQMEQLDSYQIRFKLFMGKSLYRKGDYPASMNAYQQAIDMARVGGDSISVGYGLNGLGVVRYLKGAYDEAISLHEQALQIMEAENELRGMAEVYNNIGIVYYVQNRYDEAVTYFEQSIANYGASDKPAMQRVPLKNLSVIKMRQGDLSSAMALNMKSLAIDERQGDEYAAAYTYVNIANIYFEQEDFDKYLEYTNKSLEIRQKLGDEPGTIVGLSNLASYYSVNEELEKALDYFDRALRIATQLDAQASIAHIVLQKAVVQMKMQDFQSAKINLDQAMRIYTELEDTQSVAKCHKNYGTYFEGTGQVDKAIASYARGIQLAEEEDIIVTNQIAEKLYPLYTEKGDQTKAFETYKLFVSTRDSIDSEQNKKEIIRQEYKYAYEKKAIADSISFAGQRKIQQAELEKTNNQRTGLVVILLLVAGFSVVLYNRIRLINKQKATIEDQNEELNNLNENLELKVEERTREVVEANNSLKVSEERYAYAMEASNDGIWDYDVVNDVVQFSPAIYTMLGYEPNEFPPSREGMYGLLHSKELRTKKRTAHDLFIAAEDEDYILDEYRLNGKDGQTIWVQVKGKIVEKDENGKPLRIVGTHTDITADKLKGQELLDTVLRTKDEERSRISKEIHDGLQQTLTVSYMNFRAVSNEAEGVDAEVKNKFDLGMKYLQDSIAESRSVAHALMPKAIADYGVLSVFESTISDVDNAQEQTKYHFSHNLESGKLADQQIEITLYRILQEAINNITKYAKAKNVHIQLKEYDDIFMLTIEDDGIGFDVEQLKAKDSGLGFRSMQTRLDAIDGFLEVNSRPGKGTQILVEINKDLT